ncbi:hypothetical protein ACU18_15875 [Arthrobacter sp. ZBG10]|uniref:hypothetical protein n=1 Tax=Micrococcaceae TaxID=1268 RepID=UPI0006831152|nr:MULTISPECIES: hypothetical protein [Micrococcaceae]KNH15793.1 hypothetical protein ACU18_15875 [Arthrobacter sp. ZBG10]KQR00905.1 hypothetical protein ASF72_00415 [Arthrobacter sp. Leaf141]
MGFTEIFVATHDAALKHAGVLDAGSSAPAAKAVRITGISDFEVEQLGDLAGTAVHAGGADYELTMVDVSSDSLLAVPPAMVRALADLLTYETEGDGEVLDDVSGQWAAQDDMPFDAAKAKEYVQQVAELAGSVDDSERTGLYVWSA